MKKGKISLLYKGKTSHPTTKKCGRREREGSAHHLSGNAHGQGGANRKKKKKNYSRFWGAATQHRQDPEGAQIRGEGKRKRDEDSRDRGEPSSPGKKKKNQQLPFLCQDASGEVEPAQQKKEYVIKKKIT